MGADDGGLKHQEMAVSSSYAPAAKYDWYLHLRGHDYIFIQTHSTVILFNFFDKCNSGTETLVQKISNTRKLFAILQEIFEFGTFLSWEGSPRSQDIEIDIVTG